MSLRSLLNLLTRDRFFPEPGFVKDYATNDVSGPGLVDVAGAIFQRGPVLTDEGGFREDFIGAALPAEWTALTTGAGSVTVAGSNVVFTAGAGVVAGDRALITRPADFLPVICNVFPIGAARVAGLNFFFGIYNDPDPDLATEFAELEFTSSLLVTQAAFRSRSGAGASNLTSNTITVATTATSTWRTLTLDGEAAVCRDTSTATDALPTTTTRGSVSRHIPGLYTHLSVAMGWRANGGVPVAGSYSVDTIFLKNLDRLVVNTAF